jgi:tRNA-dihydrouridine synthase
MRKHVGWYLKGFPGAARIRLRLVTAPDLDTFRRELDRLKGIVSTQTEVNFT